MNYYSLVLNRLSRIFIRRNASIGYINIGLLLILLLIWSLISWTIRLNYSGTAVIELTLFFQMILVSGLTCFGSTNNNWANYFSRSTNYWLQVSAPILVGSAISLLTLLPFYLALTDTNVSVLMILRTIAILTLSFGVSLFAAALGSAIKKLTAPGLMRLIVFFLKILAIYVLIATPPVTVIHLVLLNNSTNLLLDLLLAVVGWLGFSFALFEWFASKPEKYTQSFKYSGFLRSFRVFGTSTDQFSVQLTNSILRWARSSAIQHRLVALIIYVYLIGQLYRYADLLDVRSAILLVGVSSAVIVAATSFTAVAQSRIHLYRWLPLSTRTTVTTNWLAGVLVYLCIIAIMAWTAPIFSAWTLAVLISVILTVHSVTTAVTYRLSRNHLHQTDRLLPIALGSAIFGAIPGIYFEIVPDSTALLVVLGWLIIAIFWLNISSRSENLQVAA